MEQDLFALRTQLPDLIQDKLLDHFCPARESRLRNRKKGARGVRFDGNAVV